MTQNRVQIVILCEDLQQQVFAYHFLKKRGFNINPKNLTIRTSPKGKGAGEQFVRKRYAAEVKEYRRKNYRSGMLVVLIDADTETVKATLKDLDNALIENSQELRKPDEKIAIFVPKRNIETWIHYLTINWDCYRNQCDRLAITVSTPKKMFCGYNGLSHLSSKGFS